MKTKMAVTLALLSGVVVAGAWGAPYALHYYLRGYVGPVVAQTFAGGTSLVVKVVVANPVATPSRRVNEAFAFWPKVIKTISVKNTPSRQYDGPYRAAWESRTI